MLLHKSKGLVTIAYKTCGRDAFKSEDLNVLLEYFELKQLTALLEYFDLMRIFNLCKV